MSRSTRYLLSMINALLAMLWLPAVAYAAALVREQGASTLQIDPVVAIFCVVLATLAGATTLAARVNKLPSRRILLEWPMTRRSRWCARGCFAWPTCWEVGAQAPRPS